MKIDNTQSLSHTSYRCKYHIVINEKQLRLLFLYNLSSENATLCVWGIHEFILTILVEGMIYDIFREITIYT